MEKAYRALRDHEKDSTGRVFTTPGSYLYKAEDIPKVTLVLNYSW